MSRLLFAVAVVGFATQLSLAADSWEPACLDDSSAGVVGVDLKEVAKTPQVVLPTGRTGVYIADVVEGGFFHVAGVQRYDIVVALNGWSVESVRELYAASRTLSAGKSASAVLMRGMPSKTGVAYDTRLVQVSATVPSRREALLSRLIVTESRESGERWVRHIRATQDRNSATQIAPFFQLKDGKPTNLRVLVTLVEKNLAVPKTVIIDSMEKSASFPVKLSDVATDIGLQTSSASVDCAMTLDMFQALCSVAQQGKGTLHFELREGGSVDTEMGRDMAMRIADVLVGYKLKGGGIANERLQWYRDQLEAGEQQISKLTDGVKLQKFAETTPRLATRAMPLTTE